MSRKFDYLVLIPFHTFQVEGITFSAHRYVLAAAIPYFRSMFASEMIESRQSKIVVQVHQFNFFPQNFLDHLFSCS